MDDKKWKEILCSIFGKEGLVSSKGLKRFELKFLELADKIHDQLPSFQDDFARIADKVKTGVVQPRIGNRWVPIDWKNNYCESMNHVIKLSANWKTMKLPDLVQRLYKIVKLQLVDCKRALYGHGN